LLRPERFQAFVGKILAAAAAGVVFGERVVAEVGGEVAPHRVDVVGVVLGVVVLDQGDRPCTRK